jgi:pyruvate/2-oxoglutarate dehydrogenase complex dihydrolipoamide dehydrogenase (E3) component
MINQPYEKLANIDSNNFQNKSVLIIGSGYIALEYVKALKKLKIKNIEILSKSENSLDNKVLSEYKIIFGGFEKKINQI